jgi:hypothetical protein
MKVVPRVAAPGTKSWMNPWRDTREAWATGSRAKEIARSARGSITDVLCR